MVKDKLKKGEAFLSYFGFMGVTDCHTFPPYTDKDIKHTDMYMQVAHLIVQVSGTFLKQSVKFFPRPGF